jgi:hypothetical protein
VSDHAHHDVKPAPVIRVGGSRECHSTEMVCRGHRWHLRSHWGEQVAVEMSSGPSDQFTASLTVPVQVLEEALRLAHLDQRAGR